MSDLQSIVRYLIVQIRHNFIDSCYSYNNQSTKTQKDYIFFIPLSVFPLISMKIQTYISFFTVILKLIVNFFYRYVQKLKRPTRSNPRHFR
jgi:hypothetical protein